MTGSNGRYQISKLYGSTHSIAFLVNSKGSPTRTFADSFCSRSVFLLQIRVSMPAVSKPYSSNLRSLRRD